MIHFKSITSNTFGAGGYRMIGDAFVETTKITAKGQATIPKSVRETIGVTPGDKVSFVVRNGTVQIVNANDFALTSTERLDEE